MVIDPLFAFLSGRVDSHLDQDVKRALTRLTKIAERLDIAVVAIRHLNKTKDERALYRGGGSIGVVGAARSALLVGRDPSDPNLRVLAPLKNNLCRAAPSLRFRIVSEVVEPGDEPVEAGRIEWLDECEYDADEFVARPAAERDGALADACEFLRGSLAAGPKDASAVFDEARVAGLSKRTVERAKVELVIRPTKGRGPHATWRWELPPARDEPTAEGEGGLGNVGGVGSGEMTDRPPRAASKSNGLTPPTPPTPPSSERG